MFQASGECCIMSHKMHYVSFWEDGTLGLNAAGTASRVWKSLWKTGIDTHSGF
jgi:hypothetical protein